MGVESVWDTSPKKKKAQLAKTLGYKPEWAKLKYQELGQRGGGMLQRDLQKIWKIRENK